MNRADRRLVHLVNLSGHSQTGYFRAVPMSDIQVQVKSAFRQAPALRLDRDLPLTRNGAYAEFTVPSLAEYEVVELR